VSARIGSDHGAASVEYALVATAIAAVIVTVIFVIGGIVRHMYSNTCASVNTHGQTTVASGDCS
jgi:Flp pilus assembly pilin Flp